MSHLKCPRPLPIGTGCLTHFEPIAVPSSTLPMVHATPSDSPGLSLQSLPESGMRNITHIMKQIETRFPIEFFYRESTAPEPGR